MDLFANWVGAIRHAETMQNDGVAIDDIMMTTLYTLSSQPINIIIVVVAEVIEPGNLFDGLMVLMVSQRSWTWVTRSWTWVT